MTDHQQNSTSGICGLVLAAGLSARMAAFKPLLPVSGSTVIENSVGSLLRAGADRVVVVTGYRSGEVESLLRSRYGEKIVFVRNRDYAHTDMLHSIRLGCRRMPPCRAFFLLPGDMPFVSRDTLRRLIEAKTEDTLAVFPVLDGRRKHPPLLDSGLLPVIADFRAEGGLRELWRNLEPAIRHVAVEDEGVQIDFDTPEDYQKWRYPPASGPGAGNG